MSINRRSGHGRIAAAALAAALLLAAGHGDVRATEDPYATLRPMTAAELQHYRGGFFTIGGLEIAFAIRIDVRIDDKLALSTSLNPLLDRNGRRTPAHSVGVALAGGPASPGIAGVPSDGANGTGFSLSTQNQKITRTADGTLLPQGDVSLGSASNGQSVTFDGFDARIEETAQGFELISNGDFAIRLVTTAGGIEQEIGSIDTTLIRVKADLNQISQVLANRRDHADVSAMTTLTVDLLNHSEHFGGIGLADRGVRNLASAVARNGLGLGQR
jgi:hypothetical protein